MRKIKKLLLRTISLSVICVILFSCLMISSCDSGGKIAMTLTYGKNTTTISSNMYSYYLSYMKTRMLYEYYSTMASYGVLTMPDDPSALTDIPDLWQEIVSEDGSTYGDATKAQAENSLMQLLAVAAYCKEKDLKLSKDDINNIDGAIRDLIKSDKYRGSKSVFNSGLLRFDINDRIYKEIKQYESLTGIFGIYLFDSITGKRKVTNDMIEQIYREMCVRVKHILILNPTQTYDVDGKAIPITEEELAEVRSKTDDLYNKIVNGEDFDSLLSESANGMAADGYTISESTGFVPEFIEAAFDLKVGEVRVVESSYGFHIMKKFNLVAVDQAVDPDTGSSWQASLKTQIQAAIMGDELKSYLEKIEINTDETNLFDVASIADMFAFLEFAFS